MLGLQEFALERWFARWEFVARHNLCASDAEPWSLRELLALADDDARDRWERLVLGYTESAGLPALREAIAARYDRVAPGDVHTFAGAEEGIFLAMHAMLGPGDDVVVATPCYQSLHEVARAAGARVSVVPLDARDWSLDVDAVRGAMTPRTRAIVVNFPHSPTGALASRETLDALVAIAEESGAWLFSDEVYRGLELDPGARLPAAADLSPHAISLGVMSKAYGLAGLRVGWIATRDAALLRRIAALKDYTTICNAAPSEVLALIALRAHDRVLARTMAIVRANLARLDEFFTQHEERFAWLRPRAGSVAFPRLREGDATALAEAAVREAGVLLLPGALFGADPSHFRVGYGRADMPQALDAFEQWLVPADARSRA